METNRILLYDYMAFIRLWVYQLYVYFEVEELLWNGIDALEYLFAIIWINAALLPIGARNKLQWNLNKKKNVSLKTIHSIACNMAEILFRLLSKPNVSYNILL